MQPKRIGKYPVERKLPPGAQGDVYLARHPNLGRPVAIKVLKSDLQDDPELRERFLREARSAAALEHPNIVKVYDFVADDEQPFIVMEYIDGDTLGARLRAQPRLTLDERLSLIEELCSGLAHAHASGVVHRDIKPRNLMVDRRGVLRILDFGIARQGNSSVTREGMLMGSVNYMSPEQVVGRGVDERTDVFAAGAVIYELLSGTQAFPGDIGSGVLNRILYEGPRPLAQLVPDLDPELVTITSRALSRDIDGRYRRAEDLGRDISAVRRRLLGRARIVTASPDPAETVRVDAPRIAELRQRQLAEYVEAGQAALERQDFEEARRFAERAIAVEPSHRAALDLDDNARFGIRSRVVEEQLDRALARLAEGRIEDASAAADDASVALPDTPEAAALRARVQEVAAKVATARERELRIADSLGRARASITDGGYDTALRAVYEVLSLDPDRVDARELEREAKARLEAKRELERAERAERSELRRAADLVAKGLFDAAAAVILAVEPSSPAIRREQADAAVAVERARRMARVAETVAAARESIRAQNFEEALASLDGLVSADVTAEVESVRAAAKEGLEQRRELERKRATLESDLADVHASIEGKDLVKAIEQLEAAARLGLDDDRILALRRRVADLEAQEHQRRLQEARDRQAERRVEAARQLLAQGQEHEAVALLERAEADHPAVLRALDEIRPEVARRELARQEEAERRHREEAERLRREEEARRAAAQAEARRLEEEGVKARRREEEERQRQEALEFERRRQEAARQRQLEEEQERADEARRRQAALEAERREQALVALLGEVGTITSHAEAIQRLQDAPKDPRVDALRQARNQALEEERAETRRRAEEERRRQEAQRQRLLAEERQRAEEERLRRAAQEQHRREAEVRRRAEETERRQRKAEEEARRREEAVTVVIDRVAALEDDRAALTELRDAATLLPNDPRLVTLIRQREDALEAAAAAERAREEEADRAARAARVARFSGLAADRRVQAAAVFGVLLSAALAWLVIWPKSSDTTASTVDEPVARPPQADPPVPGPSPGPPAIPPGVPTVSGRPPDQAGRQAERGPAAGPDRGLSPGPPVTLPAPGPAGGRAEGQLPSPAPPLPVPGPTASSPIDQVQGPPPAPTPTVPAPREGVVPAPRPLSPPPPPRVNIDAERAAIDRLFDRYAQAYQTMDDARVRQIDPGFRGFNPRQKPLLRRVETRLTDRDVQVAEDGLTARATATQHITYDWSRAGIEPNATVRLSWTLRKVDDEWRVSP